MTQSHDADRLQSACDTVDEVLAAVDRLQSEHNLSSLATAAMQSAMRTQSVKIEEMRDKVIRMEHTVADLKYSVCWMCERMKHLGTQLGVPPGTLLGVPPGTPLAPN